MPAADPRNKLAAALAVFLCDPHTRAVLEEEDPQAVLQATRALEAWAEESKALPLDERRYAEEVLEATRRGADRVLVDLTPDGLAVLEALDV